MKGAEIKKILEGEAGKFDNVTEYYTVNEFAKKYGYSVGSVRQMLKRGKITEAQKLYGQWLISENADILVRQYTKRNKYVL